MTKSCRCCGEGCCNEVSIPIGKTVRRRVVKKRKPKIMTLQCRVCRKEQEADISGPSAEWPTCHGKTMPVLRRSAKWPDVPFQCPRCGSMGVKEKGLGSFNQGSCSITYSCGTMLISDLAKPWYVAMKSCVEWDWLASEDKRQ